MVGKSVGQKVSSPTSHKMAGTSETASLANRPAFTSSEFLTWRRAIVGAKLAPTKWSAATTYYVSQSEGNDSYDGSQENPWQTLAKVQTTISGLGAGSKTVFRFKRGDEWTETGTGTGTNSSSCLLVTGASDTQIGFADYGTGNKPLFNRFVNSYTSGWTVSSGNVYVQNVSEDVAWVRIASDRLTPMYDAADATDCATDVSETSGSFFFDSATGDLYINLGGTNPNTVTIETADSNDEAIELRGDGCFVENIRIDGCGIHRTNGATQGGIRITTSGTATARADGCEAYFCSSHAIHHIGFTTSGGIAVFQNCSAGYTFYNSSAGETIFNTYAQDGGHESYFQDCSVPYGTLPSHDWMDHTDADGARLRGTGIYAHTAGSDTGFIFVDGLDCTHDNAWGPMGVGSNANAPTAATVEDAAVVWFNCNYENSRNGMQLNRLAPFRGLAMSCSAIGKYGGDVTWRALTVTNQSGWMVNSLIDVEYPAALTNAHGIFNGSGNSSIRFYFSRIIQRATSATHDLRINYDFASTWSSGEVENCVLARIGTYDLSSSLTSSGAAADNNASYGWKGSSVGTNEVTITTEAEAVQSSANDPSYDTYNAADTTTGVVPEFDRLLNLRTSTTSIGDLN
jgi:hypothetical protein